MYDIVFFPDNSSFKISEILIDQDWSALVAMTAREQAMKRNTVSIKVRRF